MRGAFKQMLKDLERKLEIKVQEPATVEERLVVVLTEQQRSLDLLYGAHPKLRDSIGG